MILNGAGDGCAMHEIRGNVMKLSKPCRLIKLEKAESSKRANLIKIKIELWRKVGVTYTMVAHILGYLVQ